MRSYIKSLNHSLVGHGAEICSKQGSGYWLEVTDRDELERFTRSADGETLAFAMNAVRRARAHFLVRYFLCHEGHTQAEDLEDILFMGRTAVRELLSRAKIVLARSGLKLVNKNRKGLVVSGTEYDIRLCLVYESGQIDRFRIPLSAQEEYSELYCFQGEKMDAVQALVQKVLGREASLSEYSIGYISRLIWVSAIRDGAGKAMACSAEMTSMAKQDSFYLSVGHVLELCGHALGCNFNEEDATLLTIVVRSLRVVVSSSNLSQKEYSRSHQAAREVLAELVRLNDFRIMDQDELLIDSLTCYLTGLFYRSQYHVRTLQFSRETVADSTVMSRKLAMQSFAFLEKKYGITISEEEILRLSMLICPVFGRFARARRKLRTCCISHVDKLVGQGMAERLNRNFGKFIASIDVLEPYEFREQGRTDYDVLFTSAPVEEFGFLPDSVTRIQVNTFFGEEDKQRILQILLDANTKTDFSKIYRPEFHFTGVNAASQEDCFALIQEKLSAVLPLSGNLKEDLLNCEDKLTSHPTGSVVILSGLDSHLPDISVAVFVLKKPIQWEKEDSRVQIVVYWDSGNRADRYKLLENEFLPHILESTVYDRAFIDRMLKKPDYKVMLDAMEERAAMISLMSSGIGGRKNVGEFAAS